MQHTEKDKIVYRLKVRDRIETPTGLFIDLTCSSTFDNVDDLIVKQKIEFKKKFEIEIEIISNLSNE